MMLISLEYSACNDALSIIRVEFMYYPQDNVIYYRQRFCEMITLSHYHRELYVTKLPLR